MTQLRKENLNDIFLPAEGTDFQNVYKQLNRQVTIIYDTLEKKEGDKGTAKRIGKETFGFNLFELFTDYVKRGHYSLDYRRVLRHASDSLKAHGYPRAARGVVRHYGNGTMNADYFVNMRAYGLTKRVQVIKRYGMTTHQDDFTEKVYRFLYWIEYNNYEPKELAFEHIGFELSDPQVTS